MYKWVASKPEAHWTRFRVLVKTLDGKRERHVFDSKDAAEAFIEQASARRLKDGGHAIEKLIDAYVEARTDLKESSRKTIRFRLGAIAQKRTQFPIELFPWQKAWAEHVAGQSTDSQLGIRSALQSFLSWVAKGGILRRSPELPEVSGRRNRGKDQLRIDEAKKVVAVALTEQDPLALAVVTMLLTGIRPGEAMALTVRDLDDGATVLWVAAVDGKTEASKRMVDVVPALSGVLARLAAKREGGEFLFPFSSRRKNVTNVCKSRTDALHRRLARLCRTAGVPLVVPHSLRGFHSTVATERGATGRAVADALGHTSFERITARHYLAPGTKERAASKRVEKVLGATVEKAAHREPDRELPPENSSRSPKGGLN